MEKFDCRPPSQMCISIVSSRLKTFAISQIAYLLLPIITVVVPCRNNINIRQNTSIPPGCDGYIIIRVVHTNVKPSFTGACNHPLTRNDLSCKQSKYISYSQYSTSENLRTKYANIANSPLLALDTASKTSSTSQVAQYHTMMAVNSKTFSDTTKQINNNKQKNKSFRCGKIAEVNISNSTPHSISTRI